MLPGDSESLWRANAVTGTVHRAVWTANQGRGQQETETTGLIKGMVTGLVIIVEIDIKFILMFALC